MRLPCPRRRITPKMVYRSPPCPIMVCTMARDTRPNRQRSWPRRIKQAAAACTFFWLAHGAVPLALAVTTARPPEKQKPIFQWIFTIVMFGLVCAVAFKHAKRSHQS